MTPRSVSLRCSPSYMWRSTCGKFLHDRIIWLREEIRIHRTNITPPFFKRLYHTSIYIYIYIYIYIFVLSKICQLFRITKRVCLLEFGPLPFTIIQFQFHIYLFVYVFIYLFHLSVSCVYCVNSYLCASEMREKRYTIPKPEE